MFTNTINIFNIEDYKFNFNKKLNSKNTIFIKDSSNIKIIIKSKINKIIVHNSENINIKMGDVISGLEILKSDDINIKILKNKNINCLEIFKSNINMNKINNFLLINENSKINLLK
jgi:hypothetical protein